MDAVPVSWFDGLLLLVLVFTTVGGARRGLVFEVVSLASWVVAFVAARLFGEFAALYLPWPEWPDKVLHAMGFVLVLVGVKLLMWLLALGLRALLHASVLKPLDRALGGVFGLLRGGLLLALMAWLVMQTPLRELPMWQESPGAACLEWVVNAAHPWILPKLHALWSQTAAARVAGVLLV